MSNKQWKFGVPMQVAFENISYQEIIQNPRPFQDCFLNYGLVGFKKSNFSNEQCLSILKTLGSSLSWSPFGIDESIWSYHQDYDQQIEINGIEKAENFMIQWHLEGVSKEKSQRAAGWNMYKFQCAEGTGGTGFVDIARLWKDLPSHHKGLLANAEIIHLPILDGLTENSETVVKDFTKWVKKGNKVIWMRNGEEIIASFARKAAEPHPLTSELCLRVCPCEDSWGVQDFLLSVSGKSPNKDQLQQFDAIVEWVQNKTLEPSYQLWWEWEQGDLLIPDLFRMTHSVRGGFEKGQRSFHGYWCFENGTGSSPDLVQKDNEKMLDLDFINEMKISTINDLEHLSNLQKR